MWAFPLPLSEQSGPKAIRWGRAWEVPLPGEKGSHSVLEQALRAPVMRRYLWRRADVGWGGYSQVSVAWALPSVVMQASPQRDSLVYGVSTPGGCGAGGWPSIGIRVLSRVRTVYKGGWAGREVMDLESWYTDRVRRESRFRSGRHTVWEP